MSHPLRVALVHPYSFPEVRRGGERYLADLAWYLHGAGHAVDVVTGTTGSSMVEEVDGVRYHRYRHRLPHRLAARGMTTDETFGASALRHLVRRRYDVVFALTPTAALAGRATLHPTVYSVIGHPTPDALADRPALLRTFRAAARSATVTAALSAASAAGTREVLGRAAVVLSPGVRLPVFPLEPQPRTGPPHILFPAFAEDPRKGLDRLFASMPLVLRARPDARLVLGGPGDPTWALTALADGDRALVEAAIDRVGPGELDDVPARYRAASVTVLPSVDEAFGLVLVESLASGTPVVCTRSGGPPEIVAPGVGAVVEPGDVSGLADAVLGTFELAAEDGVPERCRDRAAQWDWDTVIGPEHVTVLRAACRP